MATVQIGGANSTAVTQGGYSKSTTDTNNNTTGSNTQLNANNYTGQQQALQGQSLGVMSGLLNGSQQIPQNFMAPSQAQYDQYAMNFNKYIAPKLANTYGAGSSVIGGQMAEGMANLAGTVGQNATSNYLNAISNAAGYAFNPIGTSQSGTNAQQLTGNQKTSGWAAGQTFDTEGLLGALKSLFST